MAHFHRAGKPGGASARRLKPPWIRRSERPLFKREILRRVRAVFQIVFNELSAAEMAALPKDLQLDLLAEFEVLPDNLDELDPDHFGVLERAGKRLHRYRAKDHRIYFERVDEGIVVHRVLHKNSLRDFLFRSKLPVGEDEQLSKKDEFWKLIEAGKKARKSA